MIALAWRALDAPSDRPPEATRPSRCPDGERVCNCQGFGIKPGQHEDWCATREAAQTA